MHHPTVRALSSALLFCLPVVAQNQGVAFNATVDGYLEVPYSARVAPQSGITVEAWVTYDDATLPTGWRYPTIVRQGISVGGSEDYFLRVNADNGGLRLMRWKVVTTNGAGYSVDWPFAPGQLNAWTHIAGTYDGATARLFINGAQVAQVATNGQPLRDANNEVLRIGKGSDVATPIEVWNGQIDEVRLWPFARTAAEIQQTMNRELHSMPGQVSTWNLNGNLLDSSSTLHATSSGSATFTANTLALASSPVPPAFQAGASTPGCLGPLTVGMGSLPVAGNLDFAPVGLRAPANAVGFLVMSFQTLQAPLPFAGVNVWVDVSSSAMVLAPADALGVARSPFALPAWLSPGFGIAFQYGFLDACGPQGITATDAVLVVTQ